MAVIIRDTAMDLSGGFNPDGTGIGDARYTTDAQPPSATHTLSPSPDLKVSWLPTLPLTMSDRSPSQVDMALLSGLEEIHWSNGFPHSSSPSSFHGSVRLSSDSHSTSMIDGCQAHRLVSGSGSRCMVP